MFHWSLWEYAGYTWSSHHTWWGKIWMNCIKSSLTKSYKKVNKQERTKKLSTSTLEANFCKDDKKRGKKAETSLQISSVNTTDFKDKFYSCVSCAPSLLCQCHSLQMTAFIPYQTNEISILKHILFLSALSKDSIYVYTPEWYLFCIFT